MLHCYMQYSSEQSELCCIVHAVALLSVYSLSVYCAEVEERGAVAIQGVGAESVNRIMKAIFRANQRISQTEGAASDVLWALLSRVELPEKDGKINTARRLTVFKAPL